MANAEDYPTLKTFLEQLRRRLQDLDRPQVEAVLLRLASELPASERTRFLTKISGAVQFVLQPSSAAAPARDGGNELLPRIADLLERVHERMAGIENGTLDDDADDDHRGGYGPYDEEEPPLLTDDMQAELSELFAEVGGIFLDGDFAFARRAYAKLRECFALAYSVETDVEEREIQARYYRCVYESAPPAKRARALLNAMLADEPIPNSTGLAPEWISANYAAAPLLTDVRNAFSAELSGWTDFLPAWRQALVKRSGDRAAILRLEAIELANGLPALSNAARALGVAHPQAWIHRSDRRPA